MNSSFVFPVTQTMGGQISGFSACRTTQSDEPAEDHSLLRLGGRAEAPAPHREGIHTDGKTNVLLVGRHTMLMSSIAAQLQQESRFRVVGMTDTGAEVVRMTSQRDAAVVVMDVDLAETESFRHAKAIKAILPKTHIVFLGALARDDYIDQALRVRASGFLLKDDLPRTIVGAIREVLAGGAHFPREVLSRIVVDPTGIRLAPIEGPGD